MLGYAALLVYFESQIILNSVDIYQPAAYKYLPYIATPYSSYLKKGKMDIFNITLEIYEKAIAPKFLFYFTGGNNTFSNSTIRFLNFFENKPNYLYLFQWVPYNPLWSTTWKFHYYKY